MSKTYRTDAYNEAISDNKKTSWTKVAKYTAFGLLGGAAVGAALVCGFESLMPNPDMIGVFARDGALALPALISGLTGAWGLAKGVNDRMLEKHHQKWVDSELAENATLSPEQLALKKEKVGERIIQNRIKAEEQAKKDETLSSQVAAAGTFISLSM